MQLQHRAQSGLWTLVYLALVRLLGLVVLSCRFEGAKEVELLVLRDEVASSGAR
jgi:hypothetical protein